MLQFTFNKTDKGIFGDALEMAIKAALNRWNANRISAMGRSDFNYYHRNYEVKQNGGILRYNAYDKALRGSNRIIYATHIAYEVTEETEETITIAVDLYGTQLFVLDRSEFLEYLETSGMVKVNAERGEVNIQTLWNYKKDAWHGAKGKKLEAWAYDHEIDDDIIDRILEGAGA